jgi:transcription elongation factor Elf1
MALLLEAVKMEITCPFCGKEQPKTEYRWLAKPPKDGYPQVLKCRLCSMIFSLTEPQSHQPLDGQL